MQQKILNCRTVGASQGFQISRQNTFLPEISTGRKFRGFAIFFGKLRNLIPANIKIFCQPRNSNFENLEILLSGIQIKYDNSLMKVKKSNKSGLNSTLKPIHAKPLVDF